MENILNMVLTKKRGGEVSTYELGLNAEKSGVVLPCGFTGRWEP
jgi:hypothetical protein